MDIDEAGTAGGMRIGIVGLGRMGAGIRDRLRQHGNVCLGYARHAGERDVDSLDALVESLEGESRRVVWVMVPAGEATEQTISRLGELLGPGDLVVDGGNSYFRDSIRRAQMLAGAGVSFIDAGVSGGVWGAEDGYCIMVGGSGEDIDHLREDVFDVLAVGGGFAHVGPTGAGHFAKMVHNGVEYALMEAYAEGYELLEASPLDIDVQATIDVWRHGSVVRSWLLDLLSRALADDPKLSSLQGWVEDSGEGRWTLQQAVELAVPAPAIAASLFARFSSRQEDSPAMRAVAALRQQFGGHEVRRHAAGTPDA